MKALGMPETQSFKLKIDRQCQGKERSIKAHANLRGFEH